MSLSLTAHQTRLLRLKAQRLHPILSDPLNNPDQILSDVVAVQAQNLPAALLSLRARSTGFTVDQVEYALQKEHSIVWTWCMRGTMHLVSAQDAGWLIPFLGPVFIAADASRFHQLGWDEDKADVGLRLLRNILVERGEMTRAEIASLLEENGLPYQGQATIHLIARAALEGILCMGADPKSKPTYVLFEDWIGRLQPYAPQDALAELALRYLDAYGPAAPEDLASWSGLKISTARQAWQLIAHRLVEVEAAGNPAWLLEDHIPRLEALVDAELSESDSTAPVVNLLPDFDTYLLGYANRDLVVKADYARRIHPGGGLIKPVLLVDGRATGTWKTRRVRNLVTITVTPFESLPDALVPLVEAEAADVARFLDGEVELLIASAD